MQRHVLGLLPLLFAACSQEAVAPPRVIMGTFGGRGTELVATADSVRVQFVCSFASFKEPIVPAEDGHFSLSPVLMPSKTGPAAIALKGVFTASRIDFDAVSLSSDGEVRTTHHVVHRDQKGDYSGMGCLADE